MLLTDDIRWWPRFTVHKFHHHELVEAGVVGRGLDDILAAGIDPYAITEVEGNQLVNQGLGYLGELLCGTASPTNYSNANARIGVGDSSTAFALTQTDLQAAAGNTHRQFEPMAASYPTVVNGVYTFQAVFGTGVGNFTAGWQEWCFDSGGGGGAGTTVSGMLNRAVVNLGTKTSAATWTATATLTVS
jgi:hypothetical protein